MIDVDNFWCKAKKESCWEWIGAKNQYGYGRFMWKGKSRIASRMAWYFTYGDIPKGKHVLHRCDNPSCVNPKHLFLGTRSDNMRDAVSKKRLTNRGIKNNRSKLTEKEVLKIRNLYASGTPRKELQEMFGVAQQTILDIVGRKKWTHI